MDDVLRRKAAMKCVMRLHQYLQNETNFAPTKDDMLEVLEETDGLVARYVFDGLLFERRENN